MACAIRSQAPSASNNLRMGISITRPSQRHLDRKQTGFTLIEVMITVAIVGILSMVAYPSYLSYIQKGKRATAQAGLMELASKEQTYLLDRRVYTATLADLGFSVPQPVANDYAYSVVVDNAATPPTFTATA